MSTKNRASPQIILQQHAHNHSFSLQPWQRGGLDHLPAFSRAFPQPRLHQLQGRQLLVHGCSQFHDLHNLPGMLGNVCYGEICSRVRLSSTKIQTYTKNIGKHATLTCSKPLAWRQVSHIWLHPSSSHTSSKWTAIRERRHLHTKNIMLSNRFSVSM